LSLTPVNKSEVKIESYQKIVSVFYAITQILDIIIIIMEEYMLNGIELNQDSYAQRVSIRVGRKERDYVSMCKIIDRMLID